MTPEQRAALRALAEKATRKELRVPQSQRTSSDNAYIAACDPDTILSLLDALDRAEAEKEEVAEEARQEGYDEGQAEANGWGYEVAQKLVAWLDKRDLISIKDAIEGWSANELIDALNEHEDALCQFEAEKAEAAKSLTARVAKLEEGLACILGWESLAPKEDQARAAALLKPATTAAKEE